MKDIDCVEFLQWCLPRLRFRWPGFRKVRGQVCKRIVRRMGELGLPDIGAYRRLLETEPEEWAVLDSLCRITISRFYRDRGVFDGIASEVLPLLAKSVLDEGGDELSCLSAGCGSGEEPYTLGILWNLRVLPSLGRKLPLRVIATDVDEKVLARAREGRYSRSSLKDLPEDLVRQAFDCSGKVCLLREAFRQEVEFLRQDVRSEVPDDRFQLILCRNLTFTYYEEDLQLDVLERLLEKLLPGGFFVVGVHESLPPGASGLAPFGKVPGVYRKASVS
jgi:chemotaxis protein methyltransferase CheR